MKRNATFQSIDKQLEEMNMEHYLALLVDVSFTSPEHTAFIAACDCFASPECPAFSAALGAPLPEGSSKHISLQIKEYYKQNVTVTM